MPTFAGQFANEETVNRDNLQWN